MDALFQRYGGHPFPFMDGMILTGRFEEFVDSVVNTLNREKEEQANWEFFLHKVFDKSFDEFIEEQKINKENQNLSAMAIETTIKYSMNILNNFNPEKGGE